MEIDFWRQFLLYALLINYSILLLWFLMIIFTRNWVKQLHGKWFQLSDVTFDAIHYGGMAFYKIGILLFNLTPLLTLYLM
ncbi:hypothetical protein BS636_08375 [Acinetobacter sp. LoGeW2-3]|uniref:DUF6868 family protein n=1 Tax=Acinetobacter sp. LoGeW2-3 TaxID=1808001 RepID=UPI000C05B0FC|nr:hypothetical protein [Acinetobacter sp. LoGeW2-3]ATO21036.1 hypothetical protein BS636_08375 [Acinetobacter sp. LoGeW2-3]